MNVLCIFITFNVLRFKCGLEFGPAFGVLIFTTSIKDSSSKTINVAMCEWTHQKPELSYSISGICVFGGPFPHTTAREVDPV